MRFYISKISQEYFVAYREYADRHNTETIAANFRPKQKKIRPQITFLYIIEWAKISSHATVPLTMSTGTE